MRMNTEINEICWQIQLTIDYKKFFLRLKKLKVRLYIKIIRRGAVQGFPVCCTHCFNYEQDRSTT